MAGLSLGLLGGFQPRLGDGSALRLPTRKAQALLAFLAAPSGRSHPREELASLLWGGVPEAQARAGLRQALFTLRRAIVTEPPAFLIEGNTVALNVDAVDVDVAEFERLVTEATPTDLERARDLYRGDLLQGFGLQEGPFEDWLLAERERLRELALEALGKLLVHQRTTGATEAALRTALRLVAIDPLQESAHRTLMRLYVQLGRRAAALRQYQSCIGVLQRELRLDPEPATRQLYQEILRQRPSPATATAERAAPVPFDAPCPDETLSRDAALIGRDAEMQVLGQLVDRSLTGHGQVVAVIGEAGIGKSRLIAEVAAQASARGAHVLVGRCYEAEQVLPFGPWVDALRAGRLEQRDGALAGLNPLLRKELARLLPELALPGREPDEGPGDHRQVFESVTQLVRLLALSEPLLVILEDVHWADEMSVRLLSFVARRLRAWSILVVATAREEDLARHQILRRTLEDLVRERHLVELRLEALSRENTFALVRTLAGVRDDEMIADDLGERVWIASEGNPLVVVETLRSLTRDAASSSRARFSVPQRVREVIERHLERLSERSRELVAAAAVIGREFEFPLLQRSSGFEETETAALVEELVRCRVLHHVGQRFDFTHDRIREVAYESLLPERRRVLHARIAHAMEALHGDRSVEHVERLAYHAVRGELRDKAIGYLSQAGTKAFASSADAAAFAHLTQALSLVETLPPGDERDRRELALRLALGPVLMARLGSAAPQLKENSARAHLLAGKVGGPLDQFQALWATWSGVRDQPRPALKIAHELLAVATRSGDRALLLESHHAHWSILGAVGDLTMARHHLERGMALYDATRDRSLAFSYGGHDPGTCCRRWASWTFWTLGWPTRALEESLAAVRLAEELAHAESIALSHAWGCVFRDLRREPDAVQEHARALIAIGHQQDMPRWQLIGAMFDGWVRAQRGEGAAAVAQIHEGLDARPSQGTRGFVHYLPSLLARAYSMVGRPDEGLRLIQEALVAARTTGLVVWEPEFLRLEGEMRLAMSPADIAGAVECFREAIDIARRDHARSLELRAASSLARLLAAEGQRDEAHHALTGIYGRFTEGFDTADLRDAKILLGELS